MSEPSDNLPLSGQLRRAIDGSGLSRYAICKAVGMAESTMSRFMSGRCGLSLATIDRLAEALGLALAPARRSGGRRLEAGMPQASRRARAPQARDLAGSLVGVSGRYVQMAKLLHAEAPDLCDMVRAGGLSLPEAVRELRRRKKGQGR